MLEGFRVNVKSLRHTKNFLKALNKDKDLMRQII